jgi:hypothetical protein
MTHSPAWDQVSHADVVRAIHEYDQLGPEGFFSQHGFAGAVKVLGNLGFDVQAKQHQRRRRLAAGTGVATRCWTSGS